MTGRHGHRWQGSPTLCNQLGQNAIAEISGAGATNNETNTRAAPHGTSHRTHHPSITHPASAGPLQ
eukprot:8967416-Alexandrium_andersonii.AAC.1